MNKFVNIYILQRGARQNSQTVDQEIRNVISDLDLADILARIELTNMM